MLALFTCLRRSSNHSASDTNPAFSAMCNLQLQYDTYHPGGGIGLPSLGIVMERKEIYMANKMECEVSYSYSRGRMNNQPAAYLSMQYIRHMRHSPERNPRVVEQYRTLLIDSFILSSHSTPS